MIALCCVAAIGGLLFGFDSGVINGTVDALAKAFALMRLGPASPLHQCCSAVPLAPLAQAGLLTLSGVDRRCS